MSNAGILDHYRPRVCTTKPERPFVPAMPAFIPLIHQATPGRFASVTRDSGPDSRYHVCLADTIHDRTV